MDGIYNGISPIYQADFASTAVQVQLRCPATELTKLRVCFFQSCRGQGKLQGAI